jgi:NADPH2:quinone reductase
MGGYAVQEAKADGLHVVVDAKESDVDLLRGLGADIVVPRSEDFAAAVLNAVPDGVDGVVDGAILEAALTPALKDGGKVATLHGYKADAERGITFVPVSVADYAREHERLAALAKLAEEGKLTPRVAQRLPKEQAPGAHRLLEAGGQRGRIVLDL